MDINCWKEIQHHLFLWKPFENGNISLYPTEKYLEYKLFINFRLLFLSQVMSYGMAESSHCISISQVSVLQFMNVTWEFVEEEDNYE